MTARDRLQERRYAKHMRDYQRCRPRQTARFVNGHLHVGIASGHSTAPARKIAMIIRIKNYPHAGHNLTYED